MAYVLTAIIACVYVVWLALEIKNAPDDPGDINTDAETDRQAGNPV